MKQLYLFLVFLVGFPFLGFSQTLPDTTKPKKDTLNSIFSEADDRAKKFLPQYAPLSPNAWAFQKFGDYQVNLATGIPSIPIVLYTIQAGEISIPLTLSFHTGGFKVNEQASWVGWGAALDIGASLNRAVQGLRDEAYYLSNPITSTRDFCNNSGDYTFGQGVVAGNRDVQPDIFSYKLLGKSGKFLLGANGASAFKIPNYPIQITPTQSSNTLTSFDLVDDM